VLTDSPFETIQAEEQHRHHAQVEHVFAEWADGPRSRLPSGSFPVIAAGVVVVAIARPAVHRNPDERQDRLADGIPSPNSAPKVTLDDLSIIWLCLNPVVD
jgi:hypothetical protein